MKPKIVLTSFKTWLPHHKSNSSDDLLARFQKKDYSSFASLFFLRNLPVDTKLASKIVINEIEQTCPDAIICCGMAEKRVNLSIESNAFFEGRCFYTPADLSELVRPLKITEISHNAGKFVCEGLYYQILKYIQLHDRNICCIFVHVPLLQNQIDLIEQDFHSIIFYFANQFAK